MKQVKAMFLSCSILTIPFLLCLSPLLLFITYPLEVYKDELKTSIPQVNKLKGGGYSFLSSDEWIRFYSGHKITYPPKNYNFCDTNTLIKSRKWFLKKMSEPQGVFLGKLASKEDIESLENENYLKCFSTTMFFGGEGKWLIYNTKTGFYYFRRVNF